MCLFDEFLMFWVYVPILSHIVAYYCTSCLIFSYIFQMFSFWPSMHPFWHRRQRRASLGKSQDELRSNVPSNWQAMASMARVFRLACCCFFLRAVPENTQLLRTDPSDCVIFCAGFLLWESCPQMSTGWLIYILGSTVWFPKLSRCQKLSWRFSQTTSGSEVLFEYIVSQNRVSLIYIRRRLCDLKFMTFTLLSDCVFMFD